MKSEEFGGIAVHDSDVLGCKPRLDIGDLVAA
jgi:hypothetical protein